MSWRDTARTPKIGPVDATAGPALLIFLMHMAEWTFYTSLILIVFLAVLPFFGWTPRQFFRFLMWKVTGKIVYCGQPAWRYMRRSRY
jgi:hypothetical protein